MEILIHPISTTCIQGEKTMIKKDKSCPNCGSSSEDTHYVSPESDCFEKEGDADCLICGYGWNDRESHDQ